MRHTSERRRRIAEGVRRAWRRRGIIAYLAGDMTGGTLEQARGWRREVTRMLEARGFVCLDPTRRDNGGAATKYDNSLLSEDECRLIYESDRRDIRLSRVILANLGLDNISVGSCWELGIADALGKDIIIVAQDGKRDHPFVRARARAFETLMEAVEHIVETYGRKDEHATA